MKTAKSLLSILLCVTMIAIYTPTITFALDESVAPEVTTEETQVEESQQDKSKEPASKATQPTKESQEADDKDKEDKSHEETYEASCDDINVSVTAKPGVLPDGAVLKAEILEDEEDVKQVTEAFAEEKIDCGDFQALDLHFEVKGNEVEPYGEVSVKIEYE